MMRFINSVKKLQFFLTFRQVDVSTG